MTILSLIIWLYVVLFILLIYFIVIFDYSILHTIFSRVLSYIWNRHNIIYLENITYLVNWRKDNIYI